MGALDSLARWCHRQGEPFEVFAALADAWAEDPERAERVGWRRLREEMDGPAEAPAPQVGPERPRRF